MWGIAAHMPYFPGRNGDEGRVVVLDLPRGRVRVMFRCEGRPRWASFHWSVTVKRWKASTLTSSMWPLWRALSVSNYLDMSFAGRLFLLFGRNHNVERRVPPAENWGNESGVGAIAMFCEKTAAVL